MMFLEMNKLCSEFLMVPSIAKYATLSQCKEFYVIVAKILFTCHTQRNNKWSHAYDCVCPYVYVWPCIFMYDCVMVFVVPCIFVYFKKSEFMVCCILVIPFRNRFVVTFQTS